MRWINVLLFLLLGCQPSFESECRFHKDQDACIRNLRILYDAYYEEYVQCQHEAESIYPPKAFSSQNVSVVGNDTVMHSSSLFDAFDHPKRREALTRYQNECMKKNGWIDPEDYRVGQREFNVP